MPSPGEAAAQTMETARRYLAMLSKEELSAYRALVAEIGSNSRYVFVDENMGGLTAHGKLMAIDQVLKIYESPDGEKLIEQERGNLRTQFDQVLKTYGKAIRASGRK